MSWKEKLINDAEYVRQQALGELPHSDEDVVQWDGFVDGVKWATKHFAASPAEGPTQDADWYEEVSALLTKAGIPDREAGVEPGSESFISLERRVQMLIDRQPYLKNGIEITSPPISKAEAEHAQKLKRDKDAADHIPDTTKVISEDGKDGKPRCPRCQSGSVLMIYNLWIDDGKRSRHKAQCQECEYKLTLDSTPADFAKFFPARAEGAK